MPQGSPTNNSEATASAFSRNDDPDASFAARAAGPVGIEPDPSRRTDGQVLAAALGIHPSVLDGIANADGRDQIEARAMQTLLWPATMGYLLGTLLEPLLDDDTVEQARWFFTRHVRGRGAVPAVRIGAQPYGILPTTAFSRQAWLRPVAHHDVPSRIAFLIRLQALLTIADSDWATLVKQVPSLGRGGDRIVDAHKTLLGILGLHPNSAEFGYRYAQGFEQLVNQANLSGIDQVVYRAWLTARFEKPARDLLARLGWDGESRVPLLELFFHADQAALTGPLIDDRPLSETDGVRAYTSDGRDYLAWLRDAVATSLDALRSTAGFADGPPTALLFLLARHALILGYAESGRELHRLAGYAPEVVRAMRREPAFVHVASDGVSESRFAPLYRHDPLVTSGQDWTVAAHIADVLFTSPGTTVLREQTEALQQLLGALTARLERALVEHLDTVSYRLDAWQLGLVSLQLEEMRPSPVVPEPGGDDVGDDDAGGDGAGGEPTPTGIHLGAYGWLEDVRPKAQQPISASVPEDLAAVFDEGPPLVQDPANGGHLLAPSLNQAVTASVLRSAYVSSASPAQPGAMAVNLSSQRVRRAVEVLDGMRVGQSLGALLGYTLERGLHDRSGLAEVDVFVFALRRRFPLVAGRLASTAVPGEPIEALEARNVVDGLSLVEHVERTGATTYPFGLGAGEIPPASPAQQAALNAEIDALRDLRDAVGDLGLAESVHQAVQGSADRAGATLRTFQTGHQPPEPEVIRTPASGTILTHRAGLHLDPAAVPPAGATPRAVAVPALDAWLGTRLPLLGSIACRVRWTDPVGGAAQSRTVTLANLGLRPIDVVELLRGEEQAMAEIDDRVVAFVHATAAPRPDAVLHIAYRDAGPGRLPVFDVAALVAHLRALITASRPLRASDVVVPGEASLDLDAGAELDRAPLVAIQAVLTVLIADVAAYLGAWRPLLDDVPANRTALLAGVDTAIDDAVALLDRGARLALPGSGWGSLLASRQAQYERTIDRLRERTAAWTARLPAIDARLAAYDALPVATPAPERLAELAAIESLIAPALAPADPDPVAQRTAVGGRRDDFVAKRDQLAGIVDGGAAGLAALRGDLLAALPLTDFDSEPFEVETTEQAMLTLVRDAVGAVGSLGDVLDRRATAAQAALDAHTAAAEGPARLEALQACADALLGEGMRLIPRFSPAAGAAAEWDQALASTPDLLDHLRNDLGRDFPVDDWLHSVARVRSPMRELEQAGLMAEALGRAEITLTPIQLPHRPGERWLALEHPPDADLQGEHLLYTAAYPPGFNAAGMTCGLLLDEWTEVLPSERAIAALAFNYDRPSSEAPQTMLLVTPASGGRFWNWDDLRQAVPDTMRLAKQRAVEPAHLMGAEARFLPATVSAITVSGISISLTLALNNGLLHAIEEKR